MHQAQILREQQNSTKSPSIWAEPTADDGDGEGGESGEDGGGLEAAMGRLGSPSRRLMSPIRRLDSIKRGTTHTLYSASTPPFTSLGSSQEK